MIIGNRTFNADNSYIMGILNVTPDSFYKNSRCANIDDAVSRAIEMIEEGADIIDIGGESSRPGYTKISVQEEIERVVPVIEAVKKETGAIISLDTYKADVAYAGIESGADMINDIWGLKYDKRMAEVISNSKVSCTLMHNRDDNVYTDIANDVARELTESLYIAQKAGIEDNRIILDPGIGFAKDTEQNLAMIRDIGLLKQLGYPVLLGVSRKSVIGDVLDVVQDDRLIGTIVLNLYAALQGVTFFRVHDVKEHKQMVQMMDALVGKRDRELCI